MNIQQLTSGILSNQFFKIINDNFAALEEAAQYTEITTNEIANGAITSDKIANGAITSDKIANGAITSDKIANGAITTNKIANGAITTNKIADGAITLSKFDSSLQSTIGSTARIFVVSSIPTSTNTPIINLIDGKQYTTAVGDVLIRVTGING